MTKQVPPQGKAEKHHISGDYDYTNLLTSAARAAAIQSEECTEHYYALEDKTTTSARSVLVAAEAHLEAAAVYYIHLAKWKLENA